MSISRYIESDKKQAMREMRLVIFEFLLLMITITLCEIVEELVVPWISRFTAHVWSVGSSILIACIIIFRMLRRFRRHLLEKARASADLAERTAELQKQADQLALLNTQLEDQVAVRRLAEEMVQRASRYHRSLIEASLDPLVAIAPNGKVTDANAASERMIGRSRDELIGTCFADYFTDPDKARSCHEQAFRDGSVRDCFLEIRHKQSGSTPVLYNASVYRNDLGDIIGVFAAARDITELKRAQESMVLFRALIDQTNDAIEVLDPQTGRFLDVNEQACRVHGYTREEYLALSVPDVEQAIADWSVWAHDGLKLEELRQKGTRIVEGCHRRKDGSTFPVEVRLNLVQLEREYMVAVVRDVTERKRAEEALQEQEERIRLLLDSASEGIYGIDLNGNCTFCNVASLAMLGYADKNQLLGKNMHDLVHHSLPDRTPRSQADCPILRAIVRGENLQLDDEVIWRADGSNFPAEIRTSPVRRREQIDGAVVTFLNITERKETAKQLENLALHDALTGLSNRGLFRNEIELAMARTQRSGQPFALLFLDLDHFKNVNDTLGHPAGDQLLLLVASRLRLILRKSDPVARFGGDEFAILISDLVGTGGAAVVADKVIEALGAPFKIDGQEIHTGCSIGVTLYPGDAADAEGLLRTADLALYQAKRSGRHRSCFFSEEMESTVRARLEMEADLRQSVKNKELFLLFQPIVNLPDGEPAGVEALLRWRHPTEGVVSPARFIPIAEECGLIVPIGEWVIRQACHQQRLWHDQGLELRVAVNVSQMQFRQREFVQVVEHALTDSGANPAQLELELTETILMKDVQEGSIVMKELHDLGVRLSIDDFGTGYSSLSYLHQLPADTLKIDRSFVADIDKGEHERSIVKTIIDLGHNIGMNVVGEGVETPEQRQYLCDQGCDEMQGFLFSRPISASEIEQLFQPSEPRELAEIA